MYNAWEYRRTDIKLVRPGHLFPKLSYVSHSPGMCILLCVDSPTAACIITGVTQFLCWLFWPTPVFASLLAAKAFPLACFLGAFAPACFFADLAVLCFFADFAAPCILLPFQKACAA